MKTIVSVLIALVLAAPALADQTTQAPDLSQVAEGTPYTACSTTGSGWDAKQNCVTYVKHCQVVDALNSCGWVKQDAKLDQTVTFNGQQVSEQSNPQYTVTAGPSYALAPIVASSLMAWPPG